MLHFLAKHRDERYSARQLNEILFIPWQYLRQLLTTLSKAGLISSVQGRNGGFTISRDPGEISLANIIEITEGMNVFSSCIMGFRDCPFGEKCAMHEIWEDTRENLIKVLTTTSLAKFKDIS